MYYERKIGFYKSEIHSLLHVYETILDNGLLVGSSQYFMQKIIRWESKGCNAQQKSCERTTRQAVVLKSFCTLFKSIFLLYDAFQEIDINSFQFIGRSDQVRIYGALPRSLIVLDGYLTRYQERKLQITDGNVAHIVSIITNISLLYIKEFMVLGKTYHVDM